MPARPNVKVSSGGNGQPEAVALNDALNLSADNFARFAEFITRELGIMMNESKVSMLQSRLMRRLRHLELDSLDDYQDYLFNSPNAEEERVHFIDAVTTNKTDFFREPRHFEYLTRTAMPNLALQYGKGPNWRFKLWCAGCSTGEEPYTQAMVLGEYARERRGFDFVVLATDISTRVLEQASAGIYEEARIEPVPEPLRPRYLMRSKDPAQGLVRIVPELRRRIHFHRLNFMDGNYNVKDEFEVIFFRNVMIYFDKPTQESVINKLCRNLKPGGYLFVGHSESLAGLNIPVTPVASAVFRKPL
ncbi:MAG: protein-glutamate O-methyltransferase CheR [Verrucomicrobiales bacterium]|nr:protein-glutamate O-methyltransferase CheR [Verrucomicrobiales bacterium]